MNSTDYAYRRKCIYLSGSDHQRTCDYFLITGNLRGCPGGVGCNRRVNGKKKRLSPMGGTATQHAYRKEKNDGQD